MKINPIYLPIISSATISKIFGYRKVMYGKFTWPSYSYWIVPGTYND